MDGRRSYIGQIRAVIETVEPYGQRKEWQRKVVAWRRVDDFWTKNPRSMHGPSASGFHVNAAMAK